MTSFEACPGQIQIPGKSAPPAPRLPPGESSTIANMGVQAKPALFDESAPTWRCVRCEASAPFDLARDERCPACGATRSEIVKREKFRRIAIISVGAVLQLGTGALIWLIPPGANVFAWLAYTVLGAIGFAHIFYGLGLAPEHDVHGGDPADDPPVPLPAHEERCPHCDLSLIGRINRGLRRCPECRGAFSLRDLGQRGDDPAGEVALLPPRERRLRGSWLVASVLLIAVLFGMLYVTLMLGAPPGPPATPAPPSGP